MLEIRAS